MVIDVPTFKFLKRSALPNGAPRRSRAGKFDCLSLPTAIESFCSAAEASVHFHLRQNHFVRLPGFPLPPLLKVLVISKIRLIHPSCSGSTRIISLLRVSSSLPSSIIDIFTDKPSSSPSSNTLSFTSIVYGITSSSEVSHSLNSSLTVFGSLLCSRDDCFR